MKNFLAYVSTVFFYQHQDEWNNIVRIDRSSYSDEQNRIIDWAKEYIAKHKEIPTHTAFDRDFPNYYIEKFVKVPLTDLRDNCRKELIEAKFNKLVRKIESKDEIVFSDIENFQNEYKRINSVSGGFLNAYNLKNTLDNFGYGGIELGIPYMDESTLMPSGKLYMLYGQTGGTKSYLMSYIVLYQLLKGRRVLVVPSEMGWWGYKTRIASIMNNFTTKNMVKEITKDENDGNNDVKTYYENLIKTTFSYITEKRKGELFFTEKSYPTFEEMKDAVLEVKPDLVVVDSIYDLANRLIGSKNKYDKQDELFDALKRFAGEGVETNGVVYRPRIFCGNQLNRAGNSKDNANQNDISGSYSGAYDADMVMILTKNNTIKPENSTIYNLYSTKVRDSEEWKGTYEINWKEMIFQFKDYFGVSYHNNALDQIDFAKEFEAYKIAKGIR